MIGSGAVGVRSALRARANIETFWHVVDVYALGRRWTVLILKTLDWRLTAAIVGITDHASLTLALVRSSRVFAYGSRSARLVQTVID